MSDTPLCLAGANGDQHHAFVPKRQTTINADRKGQYVDISELYCQKCGQVMFLTGRGQTEDAPRIVTPRRSN